MKIFLLMSFLIGTMAYADVLPMPKKITLKSAPQIVALAVSSDQPPVLLQKLQSLPVKVQTTSGNFTIIVQKATNQLPVLNVDESYELSFLKGKLILRSANEYGALHGLQTLEQLLLSNGGKLPDFQIIDSPRFPWRGLLIDVTRNWIGIETLKVQIDLMAKVKMNVLHLHLSDDQGFRVESLTYPKLHQNNRDKKYFTQKQMKEIVLYAGSRGIRVVPEFDVPGHASAFTAVYPELASVKGDSLPSENYGVHDQALNPIDEKTYEFLGRLFKEMSGLFPDEFFHIGGDEVTGKHWLENPKIAAYMKENKIKNAAGLQIIFTKRMEGLIKSLGKKMIAWDEVLNEATDLEGAIQVWRGPKFAKLAIERKMPVIFSYGHYLDLLQSAETLYKMDPALEMGLKQDPKLLWGGEACMWAERVNEEIITSRIWPHAMATAERLWSPKTTTDLQSFYDRHLFLARAYDIYELKLLELMMRDAPQLGVSPEILGQFLSWLEPGKFYSQHRYRKFKTTLKLNQWADILPTESLKATMANWVYDRWKKTKKAEDLKVLKTTIASWKELNQSLAPFAMSKFPDKENLIALGKDFESLGSIATDAMKFLETKEVPGKLWFKEKRVKLEMMGELRSGMQPAMHTLVDKMIHDVASKHSLSY